MPAIAEREKLESTMTKPTVTHATYVIERNYPVLPARTFTAFADPEKKRRWFAGAHTPAGDFEMDFRIGGRERTRISASLVTVELIPKGDGTTLIFTDQGA